LIAQNRGCKIERFDREQSGFTLLELIIVVAVLGILAAIVVVNVVGMMGRGEKDSYAGDEKTIQSMASTFYADLHAYADTDGWNETGNWTSVHNYPTASGRYLDLHLGEDVNVGGHIVNIVRAGDGSEADTADIIAAAIWMGLLTNGPGDRASGPDVAPGNTNSPLKGENGPYLNPLPESCSKSNWPQGKGTYTWIVGEYGRVYGVFPYDQDGDGSLEWFKGYNGKYP
jgi:type IV pilus assembly protein PilA